MKTEAIACACACLVEVVGSLTIEVDTGTGVSASVTRTACKSLSLVSELMASLESELDPDVVEVDPELQAHLRTVIGRLTVALGENTGIDPGLVTECCKMVISAHSMIRALECSVVAAGTRSAKSTRGSGVYKTRQAAPEAQAAGGPILVVDGDVFVRKGLARTMRSLQGPELVAVGNARANQALADRTDWAGFIIDGSLGRDANGLQVFDAVRTQFPAVPLAVSGAAGSTAGSFAKLLDVPFLEKPIGMAALKSFVRRCVLAARMRGDVQRRAPGEGLARTTLPQQEKLRIVRRS